MKKLITSIGLFVFGLVTVVIGVTLLMSVSVSP
jgi:hypothetical protein